MLVGGERRLPRESSGELDIVIFAFFFSASYMKHMLILA